MPLNSEVIPSMRLAHAVSMCISGLLKLVLKKALDIAVAHGNFQGRAGGGPHPGPQRLEKGSTAGAGRTATES